jgi:tetraacyldisaccharide 4'-kinase
VLDPGQFRELVSGRQKGLAANALRGVLRAAEVPYTLAVRWRNWRFDQGHAAVLRVPVPVVSVGNITLGGTGKTPLVEWLARRFLERGIRPAIVSRGYGAKEGEPNDEAMELAARLPGVPHEQSPDRFAAACRAVERHDARIVLIDDGFQHRRLHRDLDIVLLDALEPFGFGHVFPRGTLREPAGGLSRADVIVLSRADLATAEERQAIRREARRLAPNAAWAEVVHRPVGLVGGDGDGALTALEGARVAALCGIGNPAAFRRTLETCGSRIGAWREFPDHFAYGPADVAELERWIAGQKEVSAAVCTHKDLVKIGRSHLAGRPLWAVVIGCHITAGEESLESRLREVLERARGGTP